MSRTPCNLCIALCLALTAVGSGPLAAADQQLRNEIKTATDVAMRHLRFLQQDDGSWDGSVMATGMVVRAFVDSPRHYRAADGPFVRDALAFLASRARPDGAIFDRDPQLVSTAVALGALAREGGDTHSATVAAASRFLVDRLLEVPRGLPAGEALGLKETALVLDALSVAGLPVDHPVWAKATEILEWCGVDLGGSTSSQPQAASEICAGASEPADDYAALVILARARREAESAAIETLLRSAAPGLRPEPSGDVDPSPAYEYFFLAGALETFASHLGADGGPRWQHDLTAKLRESQAFEGYWPSDDSAWLGGRSTISTSFAILAMNRVYAN